MRKSGTITINATVLSNLHDEFCKAALGQGAKRNDALREAMRIYIDKYKSSAITTKECD